MFKYMYVCLSMHIYNLFRYEIYCKLNCYCLIKLKMLMVKDYANCINLDNLFYLHSLFNLHFLRNNPNLPMLVE